MLEIAILGATGYTGAELIRLLYNHPGARVSFLSSESHAGSFLDRTLPQFYGLLEQKLHPLQVDAVPEEVELVFCALPHGSAGAVVPALLSKGKKVIDLSADFRLRDPSLYDRWYGRSHPAVELLGDAVYGLPEVNGAAVQSARLVANPGCFPTGVLLALAPLAREGLVSKGSVIVDAKSGVSGAGRSPKPEFHFPDCTENFKAYRVGNHQHIPEIEQELGRLAGEEDRITFTPHLVPMIRGILSTIYLNLKKELSQDWLDSFYRDFYARHPFVRVLESPLLPETRLVRGSNYCDLALRFDTRTGRLVIISAIDNLVKGAAGQAVQNMNLMYGFPEETGLSSLPV